MPYVGPGIIRYLDTNCSLNGSIIRIKNCVLHKRKKKLMSKNDNVAKNVHVPHEQVVGDQQKRLSMEYHCNIDPFYFQFPSRRVADQCPSLLRVTLVG